MTQPHYFYEQNFIPIWNVSKVNKRIPSIIFLHKKTEKLFDFLISDFFLNNICRFCALKNIYMNLGMCQKIDSLYFRSAFWEKMQLEAVTPAPKSSLSRQGTHCSHFLPIDKEWVWIKKINLILSCGKVILLSIASLVNITRP